MVNSFIILWFVCPCSWFNETFLFHGKDVKFMLPLFRYKWIYHFLLDFWFQYSKHLFVHLGSNATYSDHVLEVSQTQVSFIALCCHWNWFIVMETALCCCHGTCYCQLNMPIFIKCKIMMQQLTLLVEGEQGRGVVGWFVLIS